MLIIFDVDGTLTDTGTVDTEVYERAFREVFGTRLPSTDWTAYENATDRGIAEEAIRQLGLDAARLDDFRTRFVAALRGVLEAERARAIPGADLVLDRLVGRGYAVGIATGSWEEAARAKLAAAGVPLGGRVLVGCDAHGRREDIISEACRRAGPLHRAIYVGDGTWDVRAAARLGLPFVGVDPDGTGALHRGGVREVVRDYRDLDAFVRALETATSA